MKKTTLACALGTITSLLLTACSFEHDSTTIKTVTQVKLADGTITRVGFTPVAPEWKCKQLDKKTDDSSMQQMKGMFKLGGGYQVLQEQAIDYANKNNLKPNYIFLYMPNETSVSGFNISSNTETQAIYYQCKVTPAVKDKLF